jgi:hypothetical protein
MSRKYFMYILCATLLSGSLCRAAAPASEKAAKRIVTDMAGRRVEVPTHIHRVLCMTPTGTVLIYTLNPELLLGWNYPPDASERSFLAEPYRNLPTLGGWYGKTMHSQSRWLSEFRTRRIFRLLFSTAGWSICRKPMKKPGSCWVAGRARQSLPLNAAVR